MADSSANERARMQELEAELADLRDKASKSDAVLAASREALRVVELKLEQTEGALWQLSQLITHAGIPIVIADPQGLITDLNKEAETRFDKSRKEMLGASLKDIVPTGRRDVVDAMLAECRGGNRVHDVEQRLWGPRQDGRASWLMLSPIRDRLGEVTGVVLAEDLRELKATGVLLEDVNKELQNLALSDSLTQLANRHQFERVFAQEMSRAARRRQVLSLAIIDVDQFKAYNDALGHPAGDACLRVVSQAIKGCLLRPADHVARYGGEEFAALMPDTGLAGARLLGERIRKAIEATRTPHPDSFVSDIVTASVGVATAHVVPGLSSSALLHAADRALYKAKEAGRNRVHATELPAEAEAGAELEAEG